MRRLRLAQGRRDGAGRRGRTPVRLKRAKSELFQGLSFIRANLRFGIRMVNLVWPARVCVVPSTFLGTLFAQLSNSCCDATFLSYCRPQGLLPWEDGNLSNVESRHSVSCPGDIRRCVTLWSLPRSRRDREDINSVCLTVVAQLLEKYSIPKDRVGRIEVRRGQREMVGTEVWPWRSTCLVAVSYALC